MDGARRTLDAIPDRVAPGSAVFSLARFEKFRLELLARNYQGALDSSPRPCGLRSTTMVVHPQGSAGGLHLSFDGRRGAGA